MEESNSQQDLFGINDLESPSQNPEWPALSKSTPAEKTLPTANTIQLGKRTTEQTATPSPWSQKRKIEEDYVKDRMEKYAQYFEKDRILPILELVEVEEPKSYLMIYIRL